MLKTEDIHPPKTGISVHLPSSLGERNCKTSLFSRVPNRYHSIYSILQAIPLRSTLYMPHKRIEQTTW